MRTLFYVCLNAMQLSYIINSFVFILSYLFIDYNVDTLTESDANTMRRRQNETQPSRAPRGLRFGWLVYKYTGCPSHSGLRKMLIKSF